jgi:hypothetical protein
MANIKMNDDYTFPLTDRKLTRVTGIDAIRQEMLIALRVFKGEYFRDTELGVDYFNVIFRKGISQNIVDAEIRKTIQGIEGVLFIEGYSSEWDKENRAYTITINKVVTVDGVYPFTATLEG